MYSLTREQNLIHLRSVFDTLANNQYYAKRSKCMFAEPQVHYLGHVISATRVSVDNDKITAILDWPPPTTTTRLRGFLGLTGYYHRFVRNYASIAAPSRICYKDTNSVAMKLPMPPSWP